jgi:NSS family neurotransmitter:Na+ symporter
MRKSIHGEWSSRWAFVLAATGSAVGLGNIWKFPYITGENGGGAFVLVYLICVALVGLPIMIAEILIGRRGRQSPINTMRTLAEEAGHTPAWHFLGWMGVLTGFLILSYYSVIAGWAVAYVIRTGSGMFDGATADQVNSIFTHFVGNPEVIMGWHTVFMVMTMVVVARGVQGGLERATRYMMPALAVILVALVGFAMNTGYFDEGLAFMFRPDFHRITANGVMIAMGHAFFTLSLGMGAIMVYGSYLPHDASIAKTSLMIAGADTVIALLAGMAIFPLVFANGLEPAQGAGLIFKTLPLAFGHMPGGAFFGCLFFILLVFAAWTSSISLIEPAVAYLVENLGVGRVKATLIIGAACWVVGLATDFSFNIWETDHPVSFIPLFKDKTIFDLLDYLTANIMLPLGGFLIALFAGWFMMRESTREEIGTGESWLYLTWRFVIRYVSPVAVIIVFLNLIGVL